MPCHAVPTLHHKGVIGTSVTATSTLSLPAFASFVWSSSSPATFDAAICSVDSGDSRSFGSWAMTAA